MTYEQINYLKLSAFKRRCGVQPEKCKCLSIKQVGKSFAPPLVREACMNERLFKLHRPMLPEQLCLADTTAIKVLPSCTPVVVLPLLLPRKTKLDKFERQHNRLLARLRVVAEHINRRLKIFRILAEPYRNRRRRFGVCVSKELRRSLTLNLPHSDGSRKRPIQ